MDTQPHNPTPSNIFGGQHPEFRSQIVNGQNRPDFRNLSKLESPAEASPHQEYAQIAGVVALTAAQEASEPDVTTASSEAPEPPEKEEDVDSTAQEADGPVSTKEKKSGKEVSSDAIKEALEWASDTKMVYKLIGDPRFLKRCRENGVDPYNDQSPNYWGLFNDFMSERADAIEQGNDDLALKASVLRLIGATPQFIFSGMKLRENEVNGSHQAEGIHKPIVTSYNEKLRNFALQYPNTRAPELGDALKNMMQKLLYNSGEKLLANQLIGESIQGARHEVAFEQILEATGLDYARSTLKEDSLGADFMVNNGKLGIDVKASLRKITSVYGNYMRLDPSSGRNFPTLVMYSLLTNTDFVREGFFITPELAAQRAVKVKADILRELQAA